MASVASAGHQVSLSCSSPSPGNSLSALSSSAPFRAQAYPHHPSAFSNHLMRHSPQFNGHSLESSTQCQLESQVASTDVSFFPCQPSSSSSSPLAALGTMNPENEHSNQLHHHHHEQQQAHAQHCCSGMGHYAAPGHAHSGQAPPHHRPQGHLSSYEAYGTLDASSSSSSVSPVPYMASGAPLLQAQPVHEQCSPVHATPPPNRYRHSYPHHSELAVNGLLSSTGAIIMTPPVPRPPSSATPSAPAAARPIKRSTSTSSASSPSRMSSASGSGRHTPATFSRDIRNIRNLAEKQRRDKLNGYINDLASIVPFITQSKKRQDKTSILRLSAAYIRIQSLLRKSPGSKVYGGAYGLNGSTGSSTASSSAYSSPMPSPEGTSSASGAQLGSLYNELIDAIDNLPGFSLITNCHGKILFVTPAIEKYLGHQDNEVIGYSLNNFLHPNDTEAVSNQINSALSQLLKGAKESERITIDCRLKEKNQPRSDSTVYRPVRVSGHITGEFADASALACSDDIPTRFFHHHHHHAHSHINYNLPSPSGGAISQPYSFSSSSSPMPPMTPNGGNGSHYGSIDSSPSTPRTPNQSFSFSGSATCGRVSVAPESPGMDVNYPSGCDYFATPPPRSSSEYNGSLPHSASSTSFSNMIFLCFVEVMPANPQNELKLVDASFDEYISRHALDGTLLYADHRISSVIGFFPTEVYGKSAYDFILPDDFSIALFAHKLMLSNSNGTGVVVHRLRAVDGSVVFLQSAGCLQYNASGQVDHFICVSRMLVEEEGEKERTNFVKRFTPHIHNQSPLDLYESLQHVINPFSSGFSTFTGTKDTSLAPSLAAIAINASRNALRAPPPRQLPARDAQFSKTVSPSAVSSASATAGASICSVASSTSQLTSSPLSESPSVPCSSAAAAASLLQTDHESSLAMELINQMTVQAAIKHLEENQEYILARAQQVHSRESEMTNMLLGSCAMEAANTTASEYRQRHPSDASATSNSSTGRKRTAEPIFSSSSSKKGRLSSNTFIRSYISTTGLSGKESTTVLPTKSGTLSCSLSEDESKIEEAVEIPRPETASPFSQQARTSAFSLPPPPRPQVGAGVAPKQKYELMAGQRDYTHLLGARVISYDHAQQAKVLSIYTPQEALDAQQRGRLLTDSVKEEMEETPKADCRFAGKANKARKEGSASGYPYEGSSSSDYPSQQQHHHHIQSSQSSHHLGPNSASTSTYSFAKPETMQVEQQANSAAKRASVKVGECVEEEKGSSSHGHPFQHRHIHHHFFSEPQNDTDQQAEEYASLSGGAPLPLKDVPEEDDETDLEISSSLTPLLPVDAITGKVEFAEENEAQLVPGSMLKSTLKRQSLKPELSLGQVSTGVAPLSGLSSPEEEEEDGEVEVEEAKVSPNEIVLLEQLASASVSESEGDTTAEQYHFHHHHHHLHQLAVSPSSTTGDGQAAPLSIISTSTTNSAPSSADISPLYLDGADSGGLIDSSAEVSYSFLPVSAVNQTVLPVQLKGKSPSSPKFYQPSAKNAKIPQKMKQSQGSSSPSMQEVGTPSPPLSLNSSTEKIAFSFPLNQADDEFTSLIDSNMTPTSNGTKAPSRSGPSGGGKGDSKGNNTTRTSNHRNGQMDSIEQYGRNQFFQPSAPYFHTQPQSQWAPPSSTLDPGFSHLSSLDLIDDFFLLEVKDGNFGNASSTIIDAHDDHGGTSLVSYARSSGPRSLYLNDTDYKPKDELLLEGPENAAEFPLLADMFSLRGNSSASQAKSGLSLSSFLHNSQLLDQLTLESINASTEGHLGHSEPSMLSVQSSLANETFSTIPVMSNSACQGSLATPPTTTGTSLNGPICSPAMYKHPKESANSQNR